MSSTKPVLARKIDILEIPKLNFDLRNDFSELEGLTLQPGPKAHVKSGTLSKVEQLIRFQLNEKGAVLKSEAVMVTVGSAPLLNPPKIHDMVFDRPFLILMKRANSDKPYFAMWIGNASLLIPAFKS